MAELAQAVSGDWRKLSAWSIVHFAAKAVMQNVQAALGFGAGAYGISRTDLNEFTWVIPAAIAVLVVGGSTLTYLFYRFRVTEDAVQVRSGALFKRHLNLSFERIQNVSLEHPFYFRPLGLVTLRIDGAGASGEEISLAALGRDEAESLRSYIVSRRLELDADDGDAGAPGAERTLEREQAFFTRSLPDLVVHGLTNNRAFIAVAGIVGFLSQTNATFEGMIGGVVERFDVIVGDVSLVRLALVFLAAFVLVTGLIALLSVLVSIVTYHGFTIYRTERGLTVKRGLLTKHEINVRKSRIQTIAIKQDWLDHLLGRRNVLLEQITHAPQSQEQSMGSRKRILVPSVRIAETDALVREILPGLSLEALEFTPIRKRYFYKFAVIGTTVHALALLVPLFAAGVPPLYVPLVLGLWLPHMALVYLRWKRAGIAVDGELVAARAGVVGVEYHVFPAIKTQNVTHAQSVLMRRHDISTLVFRTASSTVKVPYLTTEHAKRVIDHCLYDVEATERSWM